MFSKFQIKISKFLSPERSLHSQIFKFRDIRYFLFPNFQVFTFRKTRSLKNYFTKHRVFLTILIDRFFSLRTPAKARSRRSMRHEPIICVPLWVSSCFYPFEFTPAEASSTHLVSFVPTFFPPIV